MKKKTTPLIMLVTLTSHYVLFAMEMEKDTGNFPKLFSTYNSIYNPFLELNPEQSSKNSQTIALITNDSKTDYPFKKKYPLNTIPDTFKKTSFNDDETKKEFILHYFSNLKNIFEKNIMETKIHEGKINNPNIANGVFCRSISNNETPAMVTTGIQAAALTTLPECYSKYTNIINTEEGNFDSQLINKIYDFRRQLYQEAELETKYQPQLKACNTFIMESQQKSPFNESKLIENFINNHLNKIEEHIKNNLPNSIQTDFDTLNKSIEDAQNKILDTKSNGETLRNNARLLTIGKYKYPTITNQINEISNFFNTKHKSFFLDIYKILSLFTFNRIFYSNNIDKTAQMTELIKQYNEKINNIENKNTYLEKIMTKKFNMTEFKQNNTSINTPIIPQDNVKSYFNIFNDYKNELNELLRLNTTIQENIRYYHLKSCFRIMTENECANTQKPFYTGAFAHLSNAQTYNLETNKFQPLHIATGIVHASGISFETNESTWFNYYIQNKDDKYAFKINKTEEDTDAIEAEKINAKMEELYEDIHTRIFDIFAAAFELAKKNKKSELEIRMPHIGMGNFLKEIKNTNIEPFIIGCYYKSFIQNFAYFYDNKATYNINTFKIIFGDGADAEISMNTHLKNLLTDYFKTIDDEKLKEGFTNCFITDPDHTDCFSINDSKISEDQNKLLVFVRPGDEYANYFNGGLNEQNSLESKFLGMPAYGSFPEIIFPEAPSLAVLSNILPLQLLTEENSLLNNKSNTKTQYQFNIEIFKDGSKKKESSPYPPIKLNAEHKINIDYHSKEITFSSLKRFISASVPEYNPDEREQEETKIQLYIDHRLFTTELLTLIDSINTDKTEEKIIDINYLLYHSNNQILAKKIHALIDRSIRDILENHKETTGNIKFKYDGFYFNQAYKKLYYAECDTKSKNKQLASLNKNTTSIKTHLCDLYPDEYRYKYENIIDNDMTYSDAKNDLNYTDWVKYFQDKLKDINRIKHKEEQKEHWKINIAEDEQLEKALKVTNTIIKDAEFVDFVLNLLSMKDNSTEEEKTKIEQLRGQLPNTDACNFALRLINNYIIGNEMIFTSPLDIIEITESDKSIPISVAFYEHLKKLSQENSDKNKIKENQKTLIDNIKHIFILEGIKKNKDPKEPLYIINSSSQSNGSEKEINNIPLAVELKNQDGVPKEESKESQISKMRLHEQNKKSPRWLKYLTGIAVLGALCIVVKYKYNSIAEAIENSFLAKIFGKKA